MKYFFQVEMTDKTICRLKTKEYSGFVHSVFNHTFNVLFDNKLLVTITEGFIESGPNSLSVKDLNIKELNLDINNEVIIKDNQLIVSKKLIVDFDQPYIKQVKNVVYSDVSTNFKSKIDQIFESDWYLNLRKASGRNEIVVDLFKQVNNNIKDIELNLIKNNDQLIFESLKKMIGLGIGLTPSGDDFLTGLAYVSSFATYPRKDVHKQLLKLESFVKEGTNIISYSQFSLALKSESRVQMYNSLVALLDDQSYEQSLSRIKEILVIGSTSGFDLLQGILFGLKII